MRRNGWVTATRRSYIHHSPSTVMESPINRRAVVGIAERTLAAVFKKSGVKNAHAHRYRHTLATRLLEQGATFEQVADILGTAPKSSGSTTESGPRGVRLI